MRRRKKSKHRAPDETLAIELQPAELAEYLDAHQAAKLLNLSASQVYALGRCGALRGFLLRTAPPAHIANAVTKPHPWRLAEQRRLAELSQWKWVPSIKQGPKRRALPKQWRRARLRFRREEVIALKTEHERRGLQIVARRTRVRVLGRDVSWPRVRKIHRIRVYRPRARVAPDKAQQIPVRDPAIGSTTKLLSWAAPATLK